MPAQRALERSTEELSPAIVLNSLNGKREFVQHALFEKVNRILCCASRINAEHSQSSAIVNRGVLINARNNVPRVKLHTLAGNFVTEALWLSATTTLPRFSVIAIENFPESMLTVGNCAGVTTQLGSAVDQAGAFGEGPGSTLLLGRLVSAAVSSMAVGCGITDL